MMFEATRHLKFMFPVAFFLGFTVQLTVQRSSIDFKMNYNSESVITIENLDAAMIFAMLF